MKFKHKCVCLILLITIVFIIFLLTKIVLYLKNDDISYLKSFNNSLNLSQNDIMNRVLNTIECENKNLDQSIETKENYLVIYNYIRANKNFNCHESITFTTIANFKYIDNLVPLVKRWNGPISIALYAPGDDFKVTLDSIAYLRNCSTELIKEFVSFHVFFEKDHHPSSTYTDAYEDYYSCEDGAPYEKIPQEETYKAKYNLTFPINVARNIARQSAQTHFVLALDVELYPVPNLINNFLAFVANNPGLFILTSQKNIFVLPIFEISEDVAVPISKLELQEMFGRSEAFWFHEIICLQCHRIPRHYEWLETEETEGINVFAVAKRQGRYNRWEPCYIGTKNDPLFDERFCWEGESDKMSQVLSLCLLDYDFMILNNAFVTHKPGIKQNKLKMEKYALLMRESKILLKAVMKDLIEEYGENDKCM